MNWLFFALGSALLASFVEITKKKVLLKEHSLEFNITFTLLAFLASLMFLPMASRGMAWSIIIMIYIVSLICNVAMVFLTKAYKHLEISVVSPMMNLSALFLIVLAFLFLGERLTPLQILGIILLIGGAFLLETNFSLKDMHKLFSNKKKIRYLGYMILALFMYAITALMDKYLITEMAIQGLKKSGPINIMMLIWFFVALNYIIYFFVIKQHPITIIHKGLEHGGIWIVLCALAAIFSSFFYYQAVSLAYISWVIPVRRLSTFFTTAIGGKLFHEKHLALKITACVIMICGVDLIIL